MQRIKGKQDLRVCNDQWLFSTLQPPAPSPGPTSVSQTGSQLLYLPRKKEGVCPVCYGAVVTKPGCKASGASRAVCDKGLLEPQRGGRGAMGKGLAGAGGGDGWHFNSGLGKCPHHSDNKAAHSLGEASPWQMAFRSFNPRLCRASTLRPCDGLSLLGGRKSPRGDLNQTRMWGTGHGAAERDQASILIPSAAGQRAVCVLIISPVSAHSRSLCDQCAQ